MSLAYVSSDEVCVKVTRGHRRVRAYWMRGAPIKKTTLWKKFYISAIVAIFKQNLHILQRRIQAIYAANLVTISGLVKFKKTN